MTKVDRPLKIFFSDAEEKNGGRRPASIGEFNNHNYRKKNIKLYIQLRGNGFQQVFCLIKYLKIHNRPSNMKFFGVKEFFFVNFDFKSGCKNEYEDNNEKS